MNEESIDLVLGQSEDLTLDLQDDQAIDLQMGEENTEIVLATNDEEALNLSLDDNEETNFALEFGEVFRGDSSDFNALYNRPSYDGQIMTNETDIPRVIHYEAGNSISIDGNVISATNDVEIDNALSSTSINPVQNRVVYSSLATKADTDDLAEVAFSGYYDDLKNEPINFTQDEWSLLWRR